ncbi:DUF6773 family protein [Clostridium hydrogenum]|uniref:DUF6773 family protein n=1 Tax=Clostridium hydrogenum TaxID=2855764 RepID=UPI001F1CCA11|nr:DUF6773 family protein [Clostridium hydrogenum]
MSIFKSEPKDERVQMEQNKIASKSYKLLLILTIISFSIKLFTFKLEFFNYTCEIFIFTIPTIFIIIKKLLNRVPLILNKSSCDERIIGLTYKIYAQAFYICFIYCLIDGSRILIFDDSKNLILNMIDMILLLTTCLYFTIKVVSSGTFISTSKKSYKKGMKRFKIATIIGSIFMGFVFNWNHLISNGKLVFKSIPLIILGAALWGFPFYFAMRAFIKKSENIADKNVNQ